MASPVYATVASGFQVSSAVLLFPADRRWSVFVPSMSGNSIRVEFTTVSGGAGDVSFGALHMQPFVDPSAVVASSTVRPAWGWFVPMTAFARVKLGAVTLDTASFAFYQLAT